MRAHKKYSVSIWRIDRNGIGSFVRIHSTDWFLVAWPVLFVHSHPGGCAKLEVRNY